MQTIKYYFQLIINKILFNIITNNILVLFRLDSLIINKINPYVSYKPEQGKTHQEIAGFSHRPEIDEVLVKSHEDLKRYVSMYTKLGNSILDIGCGPGLYLKDYKETHKLTGIDINDNMLKIASANIPSATFIKGNFLEINLTNKFDFIYCIGVLIYIPPSKLEPFILKAYNSLNDGGILYLNYPHAISFYDLLYPDLSYVQYSPNKIGKIASKYFNIIIHHHAFDDRIVGAYDKNPYKSLNPNTNRTYRNSYLLIAQKK